jgi:staphylococcal nuclease domain-containing protein 1
MDSGEINMRRAARERKRITGFGIVQSVTSGDSIILMGGAVHGSMLSTKNITLSGVLSPKIGRGREGTDAEWAFQSKEFLRRTIIGKRVRFFINHTQNAGQRNERNYADIQMDTRHDLAEYLLRAGWVSVKLPPGDNPRIHPEKKKLLDLQEAAKAAKRGMWVGTPCPMRDVNHTPDASTLLSSAKGRALHGIVDYVREGHVFRIELTNQEMAHSMITLFLAGVQCPRLPRSDSKDHPEAFAEEAKFYSQARLLNRDVLVRLLAIDKMGNFFGTLEFAHNRNISVNLLENGLAKVIKWSAGLTGNAQKLVESQKLAQNRCANIWADHDDSKQADEALPEYQATVVLVHSGDAMTVEATSGTRERKKILLSSIHAPKMGYKNMPGEALAMDAREFVRNKLIGKRVLVQTDYFRNRMPSCTVSYVTGNSRVPDTDLAIGLVSRGFAKVVNHSVTDPRSRNYTQLMLAEEEATRTNKGIMNTRNPPQAQSIVDLTIRENRGDGKGGRSSNNSRPRVQGECYDFKKGNCSRSNCRFSHEAPADGKAKVAEATAPESNGKSTASLCRQRLPMLQGSPKNGVLEHAYTGARYKLFLPSEHCFISLNLAGVRSPEFKADAGDNQLANQVTKYVRSRLLQRTVRVQIDGLDSRDNFIGSLFFQRTNFALHLVEKGLASVNEYSANKTDHKKALMKAEADAKEAKLGMWENWVKPATPVPSDDENDETEAKEASVPKDEKINVKVTEITDSSNFFVQVVGDKNVAQAEAKMEAFTANVPAFDSDFTPESGKIVAGKFESEGTWHRVRIEGKSRDKYRVIFVDYGNRTELGLDKLRALPESIASIPSGARACCLAGIQSSFKEMYKEDAIQVFGELCFDGQFVAKVEAKDRTNKLHLVLTSPEDLKLPAATINELLVRDGHVRVAERPERGISAELMTALKKAEKIAKDSDLGVWEYGDVSDSDGEGPPSKREDGRAPRRF